MGGQKLSPWVSLNYCNKNCYAMCNTFGHFSIRYLYIEIYKFPKDGSLLITKITKTYIALSLLTCLVITIWHGFPSI